MEKGQMKDGTKGNRPKSASKTLIQEGRLYNVKQYGTTKVAVGWVKFC